MNTINRLGKGVFTAMILPFALFSALNAQHMGQNRKMDHNTMQHMSQQMTDMQQMMHNMDNMVERTSRMIGAMHDMTQMGDHGSMGNMSDIGGDMAGNDGMMEMVHTIDKMTKDMQEFMSQMDAMMQSREMMDDPLINEYMGNMQEHMGTVMGGFESVITEMGKIQILNSK
jgi:hypothetical protein